MTKKEKPIVFTDVDDVTALLLPTWLDKYNKDYEDNLKPEGITDWNIHNFVTAECGTKIYDYLKDPRLYDTVFPREGAFVGVYTLRELGFRVYFATSTPIETAGRKFYWLNDWGFDVDRRDYMEVPDKSVLNGYLMIDDRYANVKGFHGIGCLFTEPWNSKFKWDYRVSSWEDCIENIKNGEYLYA